VTVLTWLVLGGAALVVACGVASWQLPDGGATDRRFIGVLTVAFEATMLPGLAIAALHLATRVNTVCPTDARCSVPYSVPALVLAPLLVVATAGVAWTASRRSWPLRVLVPVMVALATTVLLLVMAGATYRIDVPRP
jgi:hypothetical protein